MSTPTPTRGERRDQARAQRAEAERAEALAARRRRRLIRLGAVLAAAVVLVVAAIAVSSSGGDEDKAAIPRPPAGSGLIPGQTESAEMLEGIPQNGYTLGDPNAPVTLVEFIDLQCPVCKEYALQTMPLLIRDYVRPGRLRMQIENLSFLGNDSVTAGRAAAGAAAQDKFWNFADLFFYNQGEENSGYVTQEFVDRLYGAIDGLDPAAAQAEARRATSERTLRAADARAERAGVDGTPYFLVGPTKGDKAKLEVAHTDVGGFRSAIDGLLEG